MQVTSHLLSAVRSMCGSKRRYAKRFVWEGLCISSVSCCDSEITHVILHFKIGVLGLYLPKHKAVPTTDNLVTTPPPQKKKGFVNNDTRSQFSFSFYGNFWFDKTTRSNFSTLNHLSISDPASRMYYLNINCLCWFALFAIWNYSNWLR